MNTPILLGHNREATLSHAYGSYVAEITKDLALLTANKVADLAYYDVLNMDRVVAICYWGRSGSYLLASYLDGHDDVLLLPGSESQWIYPFWAEYPFLSLREKLIAYTDYADVADTSLFEGPFTIDRAHYYAAICALFEVYGSESPQFLNSRRAFFIFLHVAYSLALGRRPATKRPLMVYAQHQRGNAIARRLVEDFPAARFIHPVRDPISTIDSWFGWRLGWEKRQLTLPIKPAVAPSDLRCMDPALFVLTDVASSDRPHSGMSSRSRAVRFEDLHLKTAETVSCLAEWLGLAPSPSLLRSTFNGIEMMAREGEGAWSGANPKQVRRRWQNLSWIDRLMLFALFRENFVGWGYPCPAIFARPGVRLLMAALLCLLPMKMELIGLDAAVRLQILPALARGKVCVFGRLLAQLVAGRILTRRLIAGEMYHRVIGKTDLLKLLGCFESPSALAEKMKRRA